MESVLILLIDACCFLLAWMVHIIIYPTLKQIDSSRFNAYHAWYTNRITWFVGPLMISQVLVHGFALIENQGAIEFVFAGLVGLTWVITGLRAVPMHAKLSRDGQDDTVISSLLRANLQRSLVWTAIMALSLTTYWP